MQKKQAVSCPFLLKFPFHYIPEVTEDFDINFSVYSTSFWDKIIMDKTLIIK
jgi:hypothetical protein